MHAEMRTGLGESSAAMTLHAQPADILLSQPEVSA